MNQMVPARIRLFFVALSTFELLLTAGSFFVGYLLRQALQPWFSKDVIAFGEISWLVFPIGGIWLVLFWLLRLYKSHRTASLLGEFFRIAQVVILGVVVLYAFLAMTQQAEYVNRSIVGCFAAVNLFALCTERAVLRGVLRHYRKRGYDLKNVIVVGTGRRAKELINELRAHDEWGIRIVGVLSDGDPLSIDELAGVKVLGVAKDLPDLLQEKVIDEVHFAVSRSRLDEMGDLFFLCEELGVRSRIAVNFFHQMQSHLSLEHMGAVPLLTLSTTPTSEGLLFVKRLIDIAVSFIALLLLLPVLGVTAVLIRLTSSGKAIYRQKRAGLYGRRFTLYKFRTMVDDAESMRSDLLEQNEMEGATFKVTNDPRVTGLGKLLRKLSIDELPQLFNVLKGDMSLVGPRPLPVYEADDLDRWQKRRLSMKPGITCTWQISGRNEITHSQWMAMDLAYIDNWSLTLDLSIMLRTIPAVIIGKGAK